ncbi:hypothetical protein [Glaciihabitans sp. dw_435]|uniref:hypothetical protein n=1 Tax=Glaciihabitans sp. dw_435 TaxID=2720081 RepID=UPI001BD5CBA7|nr:hypothetical protein [Glaciihabitans sp. dw_435]
MADLSISGEYLDSLRSQFTALAAFTSTEDDAAVDHSSCGSDLVATAGNQTATLQLSRASIASLNAMALSEHAGTTSVEIAALDASLAKAAGDK